MGIKFFKFLKKGQYDEQYEALLKTFQTKQEMEYTFPIDKDSAIFAVRFCRHCKATLNVQVYNDGDLDTTIKYEDPDVRPSFPAFCVSISIIFRFVPLMIKYRGISSIPEWEIALTLIKKIPKIDLIEALLSRHDVALWARQHKLI